MRTSNASNKLRYRIIKFVHIRVELLYDREEIGDREEEDALERRGFWDGMDLCLGAMMQLMQERERERERGRERQKDIQKSTKQF